MSLYRFLNLKGIFGGTNVSSSNTKRSPFVVFLGLFVLATIVTLSTSGTASSDVNQAATAPYPVSPVIESIAWDWSTYENAAPGSDLWPTTWANDGNIYTSWGDGGGFGGSDSNGRVSMGFARLSGSAESWTAKNVWGGANTENSAQFGGKSNGILAAGDTIYAWSNTQDGGVPNYKLLWSDNSGATWNRSSWSFNSGEFAPAAFLNFGKGYAGSRDDFVYFYGGSWGADIEDMYMGRVHKDQIKDKSAYEYFSGMNGNSPTWSSSLSSRQPVFTDPNSAEFNASLKVSVVYNPGINRYLLTIFHDSLGGLGIFDAPEPWGPWTTAYYSDSWHGYGNGGEGLNSSFPTKWMSSDGLTMWNVFNGWDSGGTLGSAHDKFNLVKAQVALRADVPVLSVQTTSDQIVITSEEPDWKATFVRSKGGALTDLRVPADSSQSVIFNDNSPGTLHFPIVSYALTQAMFRASDNLKYYTNQPGRIDRWEIIEETPFRIRIAVEGESNNGGFTFDKVITIEPSGFRVDGEAVPSTNVWHLNLSNDFAAGNLTKDDVDLYDDNTGPVSFVMNSVTDSGRTLPSGIDYPFSVVIPYKKDPSKSFKMAAIQVPQQLADKRSWAAISWGEHNTGSGAFGVDHISFTSGPISVSERESGIHQPQYPANQPINFATSFQIGSTGQSFPNIPGPGEGSEPPPADTTAPTVTAIDGYESSVSVKFNEPVDESSVTDESNYSINNGVQVLSASMDSNTTVTLDTTVHVIGAQHTLTIDGVEDLSGNMINNKQVSYQPQETPLVAIINVASGKPYEVVEGVSTGGELYIDRTHTFTSVPGSLSAAAYIKTANDDKSNVQNDLLTFSVDRDVTVYVAYDSRASSVPDWMGDWETLGENIETSDGSRDVFHKDFGPGSITLGGNMAAGAAGAQSNYSVLVVSSGEVSEPNIPPAASFDAAPEAGIAPLDVDFDASASSDPDGSIVSYEWNFGDGNTGSGEIASHVYASLGTYTATVTVTDDDGETDSAQTTITVDGVVVTEGFLVEITNVSSGKPYEVVETISAGDELYIDRTTTFSTIPASLAGAEYIQTANDDKAVTASSHLTFTVDRNVTVYVAYDARASSLPDWMADWEDTGEAIATTDFGREVYSRDFGSGSITLGGNMASGAVGAQSNYSVLVMEREPDPVPPVASFTATPVSGDAPLVVGLDASASSDPDGSIVSYDWDLGDGNSGSGETASYTFSTPGTYTVTLTVTDDDGDFDTAEATISVNEPPAEDLSVEITNVSSGKPYEVVETISAGDELYIDRTTTFSTIPASLAGAEYIQTANDDKAVTANSHLTFTVNRDVTVCIAYDVRATSVPNWMAGWESLGNIETTDNGRVIYHKDFGPGTITLGGNMAAGSAGAQSNYSVLVVTRDGSDPVPPVASFTATPVTGDAPLDVDFDASASSDADGSIVSYDWDFGDGNSGSGEIESHRYNNAGTYTVTLTVTDSDGETDTAQTTITVNEPPIGDLSVAIVEVSSGKPYEVVESVGAGDELYTDRTATFSTIPASLAGAEYIQTANDDKAVTASSHLTFTVDRNVTVYAAYDNRASSLPDWMADWEDTGEAIATTDFGREVYSRDFGPGSITLGGNMASGAAGAQSNYSVLVMEREPDPVPPVASFTATPLSGDAPLVVGLDASGSSDADGSIVSWDWDLGNGNSGSGETASYTFNTPGTYTVTLTVTDNDGDTDTAQKTISVSEMPLEDMLIAIGDASVEEGLTVEVPVLLDTVTQTVAGFEFDFELGGDANARITGVEFPDFGLTSYDIISDSRAHVMVLDLNGILQAGEQDIQIVTISVQGISEGSTSMSLGSAQLYDPAGNSIQIDLLGGALNVLASSSGFPLLP